MTSNEDFAYYVACYFYDPTDKTDLIMFEDECSNVSARWPLKEEKKPVANDKLLEEIPPPEGNQTISTSANSTLPGDETIPTFLPPVID